MKSRKSRIIGSLVAIFALGSLIGPKINVAGDISGNDITTQYEVPQEISAIMSKACMDCHSNNTRYPWYSHLFPANWYLYNHVYGGKKHLDFSEFATYSDKKKDHKLEEVIEVLEKGEMPLSSYTLLHQDAKLSDAEVKLLTAWANNLRKSIGYTNGG